MDKIELPLGTLFTIKNEQTGRWMCDHSWHGLTMEKNNNGDPEFLWRLEESQGQYMIVNNHTKNYFQYCRMKLTIGGDERDIIYTKDPTLPSALAIMPVFRSKSSEHWNYRWIITNEGGKGYYTIKNYKDDFVSDKGSNASFDFVTFAVNKSPNAASNRWYFEFKDVEYISTEYGKPILKHSKEPKVYRRNVLFENKSSVTQTVTRELTLTESNEASFTHTFGISVGIETKFSGGIPKIAENETSIKLETKYEGSKGETRKSEVEDKNTVPIVAPPYTRMYADITMQEKDFDIPYVMRLRCKHTGQTLISRGICHAKKSWDSNYAIREEPISKLSKL